MNIFEKRPLSLILCIMVGGFSLFLDSPREIIYVLVGLGVILFIITFLFKALFAKRLLITRIATVAFIISLCCTMIFSAVSTPKQMPANTKFKGVVTDIDYTKPDSTSMTVQILECDGNRVSYKSFISAGKDIITNIARGDTIEFCGELTAFTSETSAQYRYYRARGYHCSITNLDNLTVESTNPDWKPDIFTQIRTNISDALKLLTNEQTGGFLSALMTGEKDSLDANTALNFTVIGISHILALSGMHLVILTDALRRILSLLKLNKRVVIIISTVFALFYMLLTGCAPSIFRATVMLLITNTLFLLSSTHDTYTTLPIAVFIILLFQPHAAYDISLWLSAFATLGIVVLSDINSKRHDESPEEKKKLILAIFIWLRDAIMATAFAIIATFLITSQFADTMSALAPITTLIFSFPSTILIYLGILILLLGKIIPIGIPTILLSDTIKEVAELFASQKWAMISLEFPLAKALTIISAVSFFAFLIIKTNKRRLTMYILVGLYALSLVVGVTQTQLITHTDAAKYSSSKSSDNIMLRSKGKSAMICSGNGNKIRSRATVSQLKAEEIYYLDYLIIPAYDYDTTMFICELVTDIKTDFVYLPTPHNSIELSFCEALMDKLSLIGTTPKFYNEGEEIVIGEIVYQQVTHMLYRSMAQPCHIFRLTIDGEHYTYLTSSALEMLPSYAVPIIYSTDYLILGKLTSSYSSSEKFSILTENIKGIICSDGDFISADAKDFYNEREVSITVIDTSSIIH